MIGKAGNILLFVAGWEDFSFPFWGIPPVLPTRTIHGSYYKPRALQGIVHPSRRTVMPRRFTSTLLSTLLVLSCWGSCRRFCPGRRGQQNPISTSITLTITSPTATGRPWRRNTPNQSGRRTCGRRHIWPCRLSRKRTGAMNTISRSSTTAASTSGWTSSEKGGQTKDKRSGSLVQSREPEIVATGVEA